MMGTLQRYRFGIFPYLFSHFNPILVFVALSCRTAVTAVTADYRMPLFGKARKNGITQRAWKIKFNIQCSICIYEGKYMDGRLN